jgi:hypothetical protein
LVGLAHALLEQVGTAGAAGREELGGVRGLGVLRQHHDAGARARVAEGGGRLDALVVVARRHAYVGDDHVGAVLLDGGQQLRQVGAERDDLEVGLAVEQPADALPHEERVLGDDDSYGHSPNSTDCLGGSGLIRVTSQVDHDAGGQDQHVVLGVGDVHAVRIGQGEELLRHPRDRRLVAEELVLHGEEVALDP